MSTIEDANDRKKWFAFGLKLLFGLAAICAVNVGSVPAQAAPAIVTQDGPLKGIDRPGIDEFLGIPYAAPPEGKLRWTPPQPHGRWHGVFSATQFGNVCPQSDGAGGTLGSEDCLFLNIYTPPQKKNENKHDGLAVMVWIPGGGFVTGAGSFYDPTPLVEKGVIVVTINYRLGVLGFFAHPALDAEGHTNANYGLMDQQFALKWVRRNIGRFGGNPNLVTIFGESAGGLSVYSNLASPTAAGLFERAISESGAYSSFQDYLQSIVPLTTAETVGVPGQVPSGLAFAASVGCGGSQPAQCLRGLSAETLVEAEPAAVMPIVDGTVLKKPPGPAFLSGVFNHVPVISGSNHDEYRYFVAFNELISGSPLTAVGYPHAVYSFLGLPGPPPDNLFADSVITLYPLSADPTSPSIELAAIGTDVLFVCPARNADLLLSTYVPTYAYEFHDETAPSFFPPLSFPLGDAHFIEVQYLFDLAALGITPAFTPDQEQLSDTMIGYWTHFAETGNPNSAGAPTWSQYSLGGSFESLVAPTPMAESDATFDGDHKCSGFWDTF